MSAADWQYQSVSFVVPAAAASSLRGLASADAASSAGRSARIAVRRGEVAVGSLFVRWDDPEGDVTVHRIGWDAANGGSELAVRRALSQLRGASAD